MAPPTQTLITPGQGAGQPQTAQIAGSAADGAFEPFLVETVRQDTRNRDLPAVSRPR